MLTAIRILHTVVWAFFAACIVAIPLAAWHGRFRVAAWCAGIVLVEVLVLLGVPFLPVLLWRSLTAHHVEEEEEKGDDVGGGRRISAKKTVDRNNA